MFGPKIKPSKVGKLFKRENFVWGGYPVASPVKSEAKKMRPQKNDANFFHTAVDSDELS